MRRFRIINADVLDGLRSLPDGSVRCCVTSPPYWGLRDYGKEGQIGLEPTPEEYVSKLVEVFREVRRVLADDGTVWLNLGDSYAANRSYQVTPSKWPGLKQGQSASVPDGLKPKDLVGIPWRVAFALQSDGWWLRQDLIWSKPNPMPESVRDRCTKAHEYVFLLSKAARYYYDIDAIKESASGRSCGNKPGGRSGSRAKGFEVRDFSKVADKKYHTRIRRSVWNLPTQPYKGAHFAVMPQALVEPCILAGSAEGDTVLDPFSGSGTVGVVALRLARKFVGIELNAEYAEMARNRILNDAPLLN